MIPRNGRRGDAREPSFDELLRELEPDAAERERLRAAHVELERQLCRLESPAPPPELVGQVLERLARAPAPPGLSRADRFLGLAVCVAAAGAALGSLAVTGPAGLVVDLVRLVRDVREVAAGLFGATRALWATAPSAVTAALLMALVPSLVALRRLALPSSPHRVLR